MRPRTIDSVAVDIKLNANDMSTAIRGSAISAVVVSIALRREPFPATAFDEGAEQPGASPTASQASHRRWISRKQEEKR
jgi:hypothetical protein